MKLKININTFLIFITLIVTSCNMSQSSNSYKYFRHEMNTGSFNKDFVFSLPSSFELNTCKDKLYYPCLSKICLSDSINKEFINITVSSHPDLYSKDFDLFVKNRKQIQAEYQKKFANEIKKNEGFDYISIKPNNTVLLIDPKSYSNHILYKSSFFNDSFSISLLLFIPKDKVVNLEDVRGVHEIFIQNFEIH